MDTNSRSDNRGKEYKDCFENYQQGRKDFRYPNSTLDIECTAFFEQAFYYSVSDIDTNPTQAVSDGTDGSSKGENDVAVVDTESSKAKKLEVASNNTGKGGGDGGEVPGENTVDEYGGTVKTDIHENDYAHLFYDPGDEATRYSAQEKGKHKGIDGYETGGIGNGNPLAVNKGIMTLRQMQEQKDYEVAQREFVRMNPGLPLPSPTEKSTSSTLTTASGDRTGINTPITPFSSMDGSYFPKHEGGGHIIPDVNNWMRTTEASHETGLTYPPWASLSQLQLLDLEDGCDQLCSGECNVELVYLYGPERIPNSGTCVCHIRVPRKRLDIGYCTLESVYGLEAEEITDLDFTTPYGLDLRTVHVEIYATSGLYAYSMRGALNTGWHNGLSKYWGERENRLVHDRSSQLEKMSSSAPPGFVVNGGQGLEDQNTATETKQERHSPSSFVPKYSSYLRQGYHDSEFNYIKIEPFFRKPDERKFSKKYRETPLRFTVGVLYYNIYKTIAERRNTGCTCEFEMVEIPQDISRDNAPSSDASAPKLRMELKIPLKETRMCEVCVEAARPAEQKYCHECDDDADTVVADDENVMENGDSDYDQKGGINSHGMRNNLAVV